MKIFLIRPGREIRELVLEDGAGFRPVRTLFNKLSHNQLGVGNAIPPLALMTIASLTPPEIEVDIIDEEIERIDFDQAVDLVGISILTFTARRGYQIADEFRARGVKVVLGGMHATVLPKEAAEHADAVVIGEAESVWSQLLADASRGRLEKFYHSEVACGAEQIPAARRDLVHDKNYITTNLIQTTRGCPHHCSFCSIHAVAGNSYRCRPLKNVVAELDNFKTRGAVFIDDNIISSQTYAKQLFKALIPMRTWWFGQATLAITEDDDLLRLAAKSGCRGLVIGFESLSPKNIKRLGKSQTNKVTDYSESIKKLHAHGICVFGCFILGLDDDDIGSFDRVIEFIQKNNIDLPQVTTLMPLPGTRLFNKLSDEGRLTQQEYWRHPSWTPGDVFFEPKQMSTTELQEGYHKVLKQVFSLRSITKRVWGCGRDLPMTMTLPIISLNFKRGKAAKLKPVQKLLSKSQLYPNTTSDP